MMKTTLIRLLLCAAVLFAQSPAIRAAPHKEPVLVGRISFLTGLVQRYVPEQNEWATLVQDAPFGFQDTLYVAEGARAEIILPNSTWVRLGENTQVQLLQLDAETTAIDIAAGIARIYNKGTSTVVRVSTPFGQVVASAQSILDLYVRDEVVEIVSLRGTAYFIHPAGTSKYDLMPGSGSLVAGQGIVRTAQGIGKSDWLAWNAERDKLWEGRRAVSTVSQNYLPTHLHDEAYALEENGRWEYVSYGGSSYNLWRPVRVHVGWTPFTVGRWWNWYGDLCWIPDEPFGYITHHYGTWVYVESRGCWYWMPPVVVVAIWPSFGHPCAWYPGRVAWICADMFIGWVPLLPSEPSYCTRRWGSCATVTPLIGNTNNHKLPYHHRHAVCVEKADFYSVRNYHAAGCSLPLSHIPEHVVRLSPVLARDIITSNGLREALALDPSRRIHAVPGRLLARIQKNLARSQREERLSAGGFLKKLQKIRTADPHLSEESFSHRPLTALTGSRALEKHPFGKRELPSGLPLLHNTQRSIKTSESKPRWKHSSFTPEQFHTGHRHFLDKFELAPAKTKHNNSVPLFQRFNTNTFFPSAAGRHAINRPGTDLFIQQRIFEPSGVLFRPRNH